MRTVTVIACTLWQGGINSSATSPVTSSDAKTDVKLNFFGAGLFLVEVVAQCTCLECFLEGLPPQSLTCTSTWWGGERQSKGVLVKAMPSVTKASAEVSPWALREVDRLNKNPEKMSGQRGQ